MLAAALALFGTLLLVESSLRIAGYSPAHVNPLKAFHVSDPAIGHRGRPGYDGRFKRPEFDIRVVHDERGFRRPAAPVDPDRCEHNVLVYGDSFVWGWGVSAEQVLTDRLAVLRPDLCVYNFGINASGTAMQYTLFEREHLGMVAEGDIVATDVPAMAPKPAGFRPFIAPPCVRARNAHPSPRAPGPPGPRTPGRYLCLRERMRALSAATRSRTAFIRAARSGMSAARSVVSPMSVARS